MLYRGNPAAGEPPGRGGWQVLQGARLGARLATVVAADLLEAELIDVIAACERHTAWAAGQQLVALAEFARRRPGASGEFAGSEVACATTLTPRTADARLDLAVDLAERLPAVLDAMARGEISLSKAHLISDLTQVLDDTTAQTVVATILDDAENWTTGQLSHRLTKAVVAADPAAADRRAEEAVKERGVWLRKGRGDGNACLDAVLDAYDGVAAYAVIDEAARTARTPDDSRTIGQIRAHVLTDLILGRRTPPPNPSEEVRPAGGDAPGQPDSDSRAPTTIVNVMVPIGTLAALVPGAMPEGQTLSEPGWIESAGTVPGTTIRELIGDLLSRGRSAARLGWRVIACDGRSGAPHALSHTRYRPPQALQELIQLRDRTCRFPGCRQNAARCDVDHAEAHHRGGSTCDTNLHSLCRHHHRLKQQPGWAITLHDGTATWTSPTGHIYIDQPTDDWSSVPHGSEPLPDREFRRRAESNRILTDAVPAHDEVPTEVPAGERSPGADSPAKVSGSLSGRGQDVG